MQSSAVERMEVGTYHFTHVPSLKYDMEAYVATLFGGEAWTCVESNEHENQLLR